MRLYPTIIRLTNLEKENWIKKDLIDIENCRGNIEMLPVHNIPSRVLTKTDCHWIGQNYMSKMPTWLLKVIIQFDLLEKK